MLGAYRSLDESALVEKIRQYDSRAIEELYDRYSSFLYTIIYEITSDKKVSEDILSDLFAIIWKKSRHIDALDNLYVYLTVLARNLAVDKIKRQRGVDADSYSEEYENNFILPSLDERTKKTSINKAKSQKALFGEAYGMLTDSQKFILRLSFFDGLTINEISGKTGLPVETVRAKVTAAMKKLVESFNEIRSLNAG